MTATIRDPGSIPAASNAASNARRWLSVSTVDPDLLDTTTTVRSSRSAIAAVIRAGIGGVEDCQLDARSAGDDLWSERRPAHAAEHDPVEPLGAQVSLQSLDLGEQGPRRLVQTHPAEPDRGLFLCGRPPQARIGGGQS